MSIAIPSPKVWTGHWLLAVAGLHTIAAGVMFSEPLTDIARRGLFDSVNRDPTRGAAIWFLLFGGLLALLGIALTSIERRNDVPTLRLLGAGVLAVTVLGVVLMPASGFWLAFPPAIALLMRRRR